MADEIRLKAPTVEQQVNIVINGEEKLKAFSNTLDRISNNKNIQKYWKSQQELINATADAYSNFQKKSSNDNAAELIKVTNALKAVSDVDLSQILPDFDKISNGLESAIKVVGSIDDAFSVKSFKEAFESFETLMAYGVDIQKVFSGFGVSTDITELQGNVSVLQREVDALTSRLIRARDANTALANEFENYKNGSGFADKLAELDDLKSELAGIREQALDTFYQFLKLNNISDNGYNYSDYDGDRFNKYFQRIQEGSLTASEAITNFKAEYAYLLKENFNSSSDAFGLEQLQAFSDKLDTIFHQVEETSNKINSIIENGVIAKSIQNLSEDATLSDSQRSLFGNLLQDEESLKSVTALFQKLIDESNQTKNTEIFSTEQFEELKTLFSSIESSLSSIKGVLVDVGDGQELSPLLQKLEEIRKAASNIKLGLNMNIDTGNNLEFEEELKKKQVNVLAAYQNLFYGFKQGSSAFPSPVFQQIWDFDDEEIDKYESVSEKISAYENFIKIIRQHSKDMGFIDQTTNSDFKPYWNAIFGAKASLTKFKNLSNKIDNNPLSEFFGNTKELNQVVEKLSEISEKLDKLSVSAKGFAESFSTGLNVTASVAEIETLTNKVKELESELAKIKTSTASTPQVETNISSGNSSQAKVLDSITDQKASERTSTLEDKIKSIFTNAKELKSILDALNNGKYFDFDMVDNDGIFERIKELKNILKEYGYIFTNYKEDTDTFSISGQIIQLEQENTVLDENIKKRTERKKAFTKDSAKTTIEETTQAIKEENVVLDETVNKAKEAAELMKGRDIIRQRWYRENSTVVGKDSNGDDIIRDVDQFSFVERLQNGQLQTVLATYSDETGEWLEQIIDVRTAFEQVEKAIISADNKIASLESKRDSTLATHPGFDVSADNDNIDAEKKHRDELQKTLDLYAREYKYVYDIEASTKRIADNQARLKNQKQSQENLRQIKLDEQTEAIKKDKQWKDFNNKLSKVSDASLRIAKGKSIGDDLNFNINDTKFLQALQNELNNLKNTDIITEKQYNDAIRKMNGIKEATKEAFSVNVRTAFEQVDEDLNSKKIQKSNLSLSADWINKIKQYETEASNLKNFVETLDFNKTDLNTAQNTYNTLKQRIDDCTDALKEMTNAEKGSTEIARRKEIEKINDYLERNTKLSSEATDKLRDYIKVLSGGSYVNIEKIHTNFLNIAQAEREAGREGKSFFSIVKEKAFYGAAGTIAAYFGINDFVNYARQAASIVTDLNSQIVDLAKVSEDSVSQIYADFDSYADIAKNIGGTISDTIEATAAWAKNGYNIPDSKELARVSQLYQNVGDNIDISSANESLISTLQGFQLEADQAEHIVDVFNEVVILASYYSNVIALCA